MRFKLILLLSLFALFIVVLPAGATANTDSLPPFAIGYIYTPLSSGLTVKIPIQNNIYLQPLISVNVYDHNGKTEGSYDFGIRGLVGFPITNGLYPYCGIGLGNERSFHGDSFLNSSTDEQRLGFQTFFGLELHKHLIHPAIEVGIMGWHLSNDSYRIGTSVNLGVYYYL